MRNYLRVRGEYPVLNRYTPGALELPPRARRTLRPNTGLTTGNGTTSACAENTSSVIIPIGYTGNYLRVRGEYCILASLG